MVDAIYVHSLLDSSLTRLIREGDTLDGKTVADLQFRQQGLDSASIVFHARYADETEAIYLAEPPVGKLSGSEYHYIPIDLSRSQWARVDLSFGNSGAGITRPLFLAPTEPMQSIYHEFVSEGPAFSAGWLAC